jgi:hypothetical protein
MAKQKVSVTIEEDLVAGIDALAAKAGENRSEVVERLCKAGVEQERLIQGEKIEYYRVVGPLRMLKKVMAANFPWDEGDELIELVLRMGADEYRASLKGQSQRHRKEGKR